MICCFEVEMSRMFKRYWEAACRTVDDDFDFLLKFDDKSYKS
jgi:hypothetical protein